METTPIEAYLRHAGVPEAALVDAVARAQAHFGDTAPAPEALHTWGEQLRHEAPHLFAPPQAAAAFDAGPPAWLSPAERLTRWRRTQPTRQPQPPPPVVLTEAQLAELAALSPTARLTHYRALQAQAQQGR